MQVALMMEPRLQEGHFIRHEGTLKGTASGGLAAMYANLAAVLPIEAERAGAAMGPGSEPQVQQAAAVSTTAPVTMRHTATPRAQSATADLQTQVALFEQLIKGIKTTDGADDPRCPLYAAAVRQCNIELQRIRVQPQQYEGRKAAMPLQQNSAAPAGMSRRRLKSCLERGRNRSSAPAKPPLSAESPVKQRAAPFHRPEVAKPVPMKEQLKSQTLGQAQKAQAAAAAVAERTAKRAAKAAKFRQAGLLPQIGPPVPINSSPVNGASFSGGMPSIPADLTGKENSCSAAVGGVETAEPRIGAVGEADTAAPTPRHIPAPESLGGCDQDPPLKRRRTTARWLTEYDLE